MPITVQWSEKKDKLKSRPFSMVFQFVFLFRTLEDKWQNSDAPQEWWPGVVPGLGWSINKKQIIQKKQKAPKNEKNLGAL